MGTQSPMPNTPPIIERSGTEEIPIIMLHSSSYIEIVRNFLEKYTLIKQSLSAFQQIGSFFTLQNLGDNQETLETEIQNLSTHASPIIDRLGRMMTDLGQAISRESNLPLNLIEASEETRSLY